VSLNPERRRIRCIAHIINLSLQAFLLASSKEALNAALDASCDASGDQMYEQFYQALYDISGEAAPQPGDPERQKKQPRGTAQRSSTNNHLFQGWQSIPAMRKLHNIAIWLRNSSINSDMWQDGVGLRLGIDNNTRWNSWYKLIDNLIRKKQQIKQFLLDHDKELSDNIFNASDWEYLERTHHFLQPFTSATLWAEGANSTLSQTLTIMDGLLRHYEKNKVCIYALSRPIANSLI
jgi:hypothetical protein